MIGELRGWFHTFYSFILKLNIYNFEHYKMSKSKTKDKKKDAKKDETKDQPAFIREIVKLTDNLPKVPIRHRIE